MKGLSIFLLFFLGTHPAQAATHTASANNEAMAQAYLSGAYTMAEISEHFEIHDMTVSRAMRGFEGNLAGNVGR